MGRVRRIVSLVPSSTEILYYLGLGERVTGVTEHCNFPEEAKGKEKVGTFGCPQISRVISLQPDLVIADSYLHEKIIAGLENRQIEILDSSASCLEDVFSIMSKLGRLCDVDDEVKTAVDFLRERVLSITLKPYTRRPRVFHLMSTNPFITPGRRSFQYDALQIAGAKLMDFKVDDSYVRVSWDEIKRFDPEVLLFCGVEKGRKPPPKCKGCATSKPICQRTLADFMTGEWDQLNAFRTNRMYPISCATLCRPGPRLIDGMENIHNKLFPI